MNTEPIKQLGESLYTLTQRLAYLDMTERKEATEAPLSYSHRTSTDGSTFFTDSIRLPSGLLKIVTTPIGEFPPTSESISVDMDTKRMLEGTIDFTTDFHTASSQFQRLETSVYEEGAWIEEVSVALRAIESEVERANLEAETAHEKAAQDRIERKLREKKG